MYSIGHSNHAVEAFLELLRRHDIEAVADVRSQPYSRHATHFSREPLAAILEQAGIRYVFLGRELGGRPEGDEFYDDEGHVLYGRRAGSDEFLDGIRRLVDGAARLRTAVMCSEEDPLHCHRRLLVARVLEARASEVRYIRRDGSIELEVDLLTRESTEAPANLSLFEVNDAEKPWRSTRSVSRAGAQPSSSAR